jgi:hypothetical protein
MEGIDKRHENDAIALHDAASEISVAVTSVNSHANGNVGTVKLFYRTISSVTDDVANTLNRVIADLSCAIARMLSLSRKLAVSAFAYVARIAVVFLQSADVYAKRLWLRVCEMLVLIAKFVCMQAKRFAKYMAELARKLQIFIENILAPNVRDGILLFNKNV